jgi:hypothetical protein
MSAGSRQIDHDSLFLCRCVFDGIAQFHHQPPCSKGGHLLRWTGHVSPIHPEDLNLSLFRYLFFASMVFNMGLRGVCPMLCRLLGMPMGQMRMMGRFFMLIFLVVLWSFLMVLSGLLMMFGGFLVRVCCLL